MKALSLFLVIVLFFTSSFISSDLAHANQSSLPQSNITQLVINSSINKLTIRGTPNATSIEANLTTINNLNNIDFSLTQDLDIAYLTINPKAETNEIIDLLITLPPTLEIEILDEKSILELFDISGEVSITDNEQDITIKNISDLSITDKSGNIKVDNSNLIGTPNSIQALEIEDGSGRIDLTNINSSVEILDRSGHIFVNGVRGNVEVIDDAGHINIKNVTKKVLINDGSGDIHVQKVGGLILEETGSGNITYDKPLPIPSSPPSQMYEGIYIQTNDGEKTAFPSPSPIDVEPYSDVVISISNFRNSTFDYTHFDTDSSSLIPSLIRNVGEGASVTINIDNSVNVELLDTLIIGEKNYDENGNMTEDLSSIEPALIKDLIIGTIASKSSVNVTINNSANVTLANNNSTLHIGGGSLIESVINVPDAGSTTINSEVINVNIIESANIKSNPGANMGILRIYKGQLINEIVDGRVLSDTKININFENSCNVSSVSTTIIDGELIDEAIDSEDIKSSDIEVEFINSANVNALTYLKVLDGELIDESIDSEDIESSEIEVKFVDTGNVNALSKVNVDDGELIDEMLDMENLHSSTIDVSILRSSNVTAPILSIYEGELIDEILDGEGYYTSTLRIDFNASSNFYGKQLFIEEGELIDEAMDSEISKSSIIKITLNNTGNVNSEQVNITEGELIDETVDIEDDFTHTVMDLTITSSAKVTGNRLVIVGGELVDEVVDAANGIGSIVNISIMDTGNFNKKGSDLSEVLITDGELMDEILDVSDSITLSNGNIKIESTGNVTSDRIILTDAQLMDEIVDAAYVGGSALFVSAANSANAKTSSLTLLEDSILLPPIDIDTIERSNIVYNVVNSGVHIQ
ncbi:hypothetical protein I6N90_00700 [Paenibacillus sp. GSMTC-2017]|uniref:hypothetical protein n=1 Tax=Paenibacillus sp. GSMTC-2017 TaxID=2794350 RepID=UPI0018D9E2D8|nr:hypothetical protein [Paenibacillus sp. GSMTC-2017]MBH5316325.1 hypothetical protein [Paenibacillus sp. GSMTC-2017]